jgi:hypothetical protein
MHEQMNEQKQQQQNSSNSTDQKSNTKVGEYIDFEEIK